MKSQKGWNALAGSPKKWLTLCSSLYNRRINSRKNISHKELILRPPATLLTSVERPLWWSMPPSVKEKSSSFKGKIEQLSPNRLKSEAKGFQISKKKDSSVEYQDHQKSCTHSYHIVFQCYHMQKWDYTCYCESEVSWFSGLLPKSVFCLPSTSKDSWEVFWAASQSPLSPLITWT